MTKREDVRKSHDTGRLVYWLVFQQANVYLVDANSIEDASTELLRKLGYASKLYLARDWKVRLATPEEVEQRLKQNSDKGEVEIRKAVARQRERMHFHE